MYKYHKGLNQFSLTSQGPNPSEKQARLVKEILSESRKLIFGIKKEKIRPIIFLLISLFLFTFLLIFSLVIPMTLRLWKISLLGTTTLLLIIFLFFSIINFKRKWTRQRNEKYKWKYQDDPSIILFKYFNKKEKRFYEKCKQYNLSLSFGFTTRTDYNKTQTTASKDSESSISQERKKPNKIFYVCFDLKNPNNEKNEKIRLKKKDPKNSSYDPSILLVAIPRRKGRGTQMGGERRGLKIGKEGKNGVKVEVKIADDLNVNGTKSLVSNRITFPDEKPALRFSNAKLSKRRKGSDIPLKEEYYESGNIYTKRKFTVFETCGKKLENRDLIFPENSQNP